MNELQQIQRTLQNYLRDVDADFEIAATLIGETVEVPRAVRLNIYANAYQARIVEALSTDFGMLHTYLGDEAFSGLTRAYIAQYPSRYFSLRGVGTYFSEFLRTTLPYAEHGELHELAAFEWALCHAFDAVDAVYASAADFSALVPTQWAELTLQFVPAANVLELHSNATAIWKSLSADQPPPAVVISTEPQYWLIWRRDLKLMFRPIDRIEKIAFDLFAASAMFADVCGQLAEYIPEGEVPSRAAALLQQWLQDALIATPKVIQ